VIAERRWQRQDPNPSATTNVWRTVWRSAAARKRRPLQRLVRRCRGQRTQTRPNNDYRPWVRSGLRSGPPMNTSGHDRQVIEPLHRSRIRRTPCRSAAGGRLRPTVRCNGLFGSAAGMITQISSQKKLEMSKYTVMRLPSGVLKYNSSAGAPSHFARACISTLAPG